jgi:hypothetical protein
LLVEEVQTLVAVVLEVYAQLLQILAVEVV